MYRCLVSSLFPVQFNFVGRLLGPRGLTLKRMQTETNCRMTIMGRGSIRDPAKVLSRCGNVLYSAVCSLLLCRVLVGSVKYLLATVRRC